jgi:cytochrome c biogenesis protein CcmG/thiol:disulfide interchange protein DsbE
VYRLRLPAAAGFAATFGLLLAGCSSSARLDKAAAVKPDQDRKTAPDFTLKDANGKPVRLSDYRGKVVLLDFWATWCDPCAMEIPWFMDLERRNKDHGFEVLGVSMDDEGWDVVKPFVAKLGMNYRVLMGNDLTAQLYGGVDSLPTTFLIDREGRIAAVHVGLADRRDFEDGVERLLQAPQPGGAGRATATMAALAGGAK